MNSYQVFPYLSLIVLLTMLSFISGGRGFANPIVYKWMPLISLALFSGLRYQTGYDWMPYTELFERIPTVWSEGLFNLDLSNLPNMEPGYITLNFVVRFFGLSVDYLFLICAIFNVFALSRLLASIRCNIPLAILIHVGFCLILFYFSTVRQGVAVGLVFIACRELLLRRRIYIIVLCCCVSLTFHVSAFMYFPVLLLTYFKINLNIIAFILFVIFVGLPMSYYDLTGFLFDFVVHQSGLTFFNKFFIYTGVERESSVATTGLLILNLISLVYISRHKKSQPDTISLLSIYSAMSLIITILLFANNSSIWSRMMMFSATIQGFWYAAHCANLPTLRARVVTLVCSGITVSVYIFNLDRNSDFMLPYQTVFDRDYGNIDASNEILTLRIYRGDF
jgi:hypothetical protein